MLDQHGHLLIAIHSKQLKHSGLKMEQVGFKAAPLLVDILSLLTLRNWSLCAVDTLTLLHEDIVDVTTSCNRLYPYIITIDFDFSLQSIIRLIFDHYIASYQASHTSIQGHHVFRYHKHPSTAFYYHYSYTYIYHINRISLYFMYTLVLCLSGLLSYYDSYVFVITNKTFGLMLNFKFINWVAQHRLPRWHKLKNGV